LKGKNVLNNAGKAMGNASKATLPKGEKLSDKIQQSKVNQGVNNTNKNSAGKKNDDANGKQQPNGKTSSGLPDVQQMGTQAAKEALKKAAGVVPYTKWIPKGIRDKIIDKFMDSSAGQAMVEKGFKKVKMSLILGIIGTVGGLLMWLFLMAATLTLILAPIAWIGDLLSGIGEFFEKLGNWFSGDGWCVESACQQLAYEEYYDTLNKAIANYKGSCEINEDLITATIFYGQMVTEENETEDDEDNMNKTYFDYLDVDEGTGIGESPTAKEKINGLIKVYLKGEEMTTDDTIDESGFVEVSECAGSAIKYREYLIDKYIDAHYPSAVTNDRTKEDIADEILKMGGILSGSSLTIIEDTDGLFTMLPAGLNLRMSSQPAHCRCHPVDHVWKSHKGVDIGGAPYGTEILAFADGVVESVTIATSKSCGSSIIKLKHTNENGEVYYTRYVHLNRASNVLLSNNLKAGTNVVKGQVIGYVGGTVDEDSCSTGPHLHFEVHNSEGKVINPVVALNNVKNGIDILANQELIEACAYNGGAC